MEKPRNAKERQPLLKGVESWEKLGDGGPQSVEDKECGGCLKEGEERCQVNSGPGQDCDS